MKIVQIQELTKKYGDNVAVDNISFSINEGEIFGLLGPNGAGKSSAIHMIGGCFRWIRAVLKSGQGYQAK